MVSKTHTMTLGRWKNKINLNVGTSFAPKQKNKITFFDVIAAKLVDIVFNQKISNIIEVNWNYVIP